MIKGVNKRIIEINNPDSLYFEKAIFYLKPNVRELPTAVAESEVRKYMDRLNLEEFSFKRRKHAKQAFLLLAALSSAAAVLIAFLL